MFFTNVSHEFRTPLTLIISHIDLLLQKPSLSPVVYNQVLKIRKNAYQLNNLITELLEFRKLTQHRFDKQPLSEIDLTSINPLDKDLLKRTSDIIERHLDDTRFGIPVLCEELGIGRSLLYAKFKALTGMTPNNFLLNYRLKQAAVLLKQPTGISIAEVSDRCGFSTPVYFSQCFKKQYGMTPQAYRKQQVTAPE